MLCNSNGNDTGVVILREVWLQTCEIETIKCLWKLTFAPPFLTQIEVSQKEHAAM